MVLKKDILQAAGVTQVCDGHPAGCEVTTHALRNLFTAMHTYVLLLVDADNAFNSLNCAIALHYTPVLHWPLLLSTCIYQSSSRLFVTGGMELSSEEGTTHGCRLSMAFYAISVVATNAATQTRWTALLQYMCGFQTMLQREGT